MAPLVLAILLSIFLLCTHVQSLGLLHEDATNTISLDAELNSNSHRSLRRKRSNSPPLSKLTDNIPHFVRTSEFWEVDRSVLNLFKQDRLDGRRVFIRRYDFDNDYLHSCYEYKALNNITNELIRSNQFCHPAIMITGVPKCSTSASYHLLERFPNIRLLYSKEACMDYFFDHHFDNHLDSLGSGGIELGGSVLLNACVQLNTNMIMRKVLHNPNTFYIVVIRDYVDWLWSSYNYWCQMDFDDGCDSMTKWIQVGHHDRSPELFHSIAMGLNTTVRVNVTASKEMPELPISVIFKRDMCRFAQTAFQAYIERLWDSVDIENTLIIASEMLESDPGRIADMVNKKLGFEDFNTDVLKLNQFASVRYNTHAASGVDAKQKVETFRPGLYPASGLKPILPETRKFLHGCWSQGDCQWASMVTGWDYNCTSTASVSTYAFVFTSQIWKS